MLDGTLWYAYVAGNPTSATDATGLSTTYIFRLMAATPAADNRIAAASGGQPYVGHVWIEMMQVETVKDYSGRELTSVTTHDSWGLGPEQSGDFAKTLTTGQSVPGMVYDNDHDRFETQGKVTPPTANPETSPSAPGGQGRIESLSVSMSKAEYDATVAGLDSAVAPPYNVWGVNGGEMCAMWALEQAQSVLEGHGTRLNVRTESWNAGIQEMRSGGADYSQLSSRYKPAVARASSEYDYRRTQNQDSTAPTPVDVADAINEEHRRPVEAARQEGAEQTAAASRGDTRSFY